MGCTRGTERNAAVSPGPLGRAPGRCAVWAGWGGGCRAAARRARCGLRRGPCWTAAGIRAGTSHAAPLRGRAERCGRHPRSMPSPEAVIFDNDGLLLDTEDAWTRAEETLFARRDRVFTLDHKRSLIGSARTAAAMKLEAMLDLAGDGEMLMDELHGLVMEEALAGVEPRPGALELLERLIG